jgi:hypothetical protein
MFLNAKFARGMVCFDVVDVLEKKNIPHCLNSKGETIHRMYRNHDYFGDGSVHDT